MNLSKPVALVLGGTNSHRELIEHLIRRGYYTILVDYYQNPVSKAAANYHIVESTLDKDKVLEIALVTKASLVISTSIDQAHVTACYVGEKLGLPIPFSYNTALEISDKTLMKQKMWEFDIPTSKFIILNEQSLPDVSALEFPLVVKPSDSNGSKGVRRVDNLLELNAFLPDAFKVSRSKSVVVEEFVEGIEVGVDCFIANEESHIISMHQKRKPNFNDGSVIFSIGSLSPPNISETAKKNIKIIADKIANAYNLKNTPLLIQVIVLNDHVKVIEFAPRIGGGLNFIKIKQFTQFDIVDAAIDSFLGIPVKPEYVKPDFFYSENHIYTEPGVFGEIIGYEKLIESDVIVGLYPNKTKGMEIKPGKASRDRAASFIVKASSKEEIVNKVNTALHSIKVVDVNGRELSFLENYKNLLF